MQKLSAGSSGSAVAEEPTRRRYSRAEIEAILGRAARAQAERDGAERDGVRESDDSVSRSVALATAHEMAEALQLDHDLVDEAFESYLSETEKKRAWMLRLELQPERGAIARRLVSELSRAMDDLCYPDVVCRAVPSSYVIDSKTHEEMEFLRSLVVAHTLIPLKNRAGTVPATRVVLRSRRWEWTWALGFFPWRQLAIDRYLTLEIVELDGQLVVMGTLHDEELLPVIGPILERLEDDFTDLVTIGMLRYDFSGSS